MYKGYIEVTPTEGELAELYSNLNNNIYNCLINQYVVIKDANDCVIDKLKWNGTAYVHLSYKQINNEHVGKIKPRNLQQELAFDLFQDKNTTVKIITGKFGSGKSMIAVDTALQLVKDGKFDKLIWIRNNHEVKDTKSIGALPGEFMEKMLWTAMPIADTCAIIVAGSLLLMQVRKLKRMEHDMRFSR